ncbi:MAG: gamma-glutamyltransferase [Gaiellaceae bacterium MAG52_C11]|nr:gamma-glutamyltransferase [Candidatus Gaiellasilicea maunaloa]
MRRRPLRSLAVLLVVGVAALAAQAGALADAPSQGPPTAIGTGGAAATVDTLATQAAVDTLRHGGNAVDAAVTAAAVLGVTEPFSAGIGGGGFMVIYRASDRIVTTIDGRETAPAAMHPDSFWENGKPLPFNDARYSGLSVGTPGTVETWADALDHYGTTSLGHALAPAIRVAREGFVVDQTFFDQTQGNVDYFDDIPATAALFLDPDGTPRDVGTVFRNPDLARTYSRIGQLGAKGFYRGAVAEALVQTVRNPVVSPTANHTWRPGLMTMRDLRAYTAPEREPTHVSYRGLDVYGMAPPSSGGSTVGEALNILEGYELSAMTREEALHRYLEASRYSFADRGAYLADPGYFDVPLVGLLSDGFAATRRALITGTAATSPVAPGDPYRFDGGEGATVQASPSETRAGTTTHLTTADRWGTVVSYTLTIESTGGAGLVVPGWGFLANNELTDFNFDSLTHPNRADGGKRPRSSMSPTIVLDDGKPLLAVGSPGGSTIITTVLQILINRLDLGLTLPEAIADPRLTQRNTATTLAEPAFIATAEATALKARGHVFGSTSEIGAATGIEFLGGHRLLAAAEPVRRGGGSAMVVSPEP